MSNKNSTKLSDFFSVAPLPEHGPKWSSLWAEAYTPWDRGGPSLALYDVLLSRPDLVPPAANLVAGLKVQSENFEQPASHQQPLALVPGCGRGHDALLLAAMGCESARGSSCSPRTIYHKPGFMTTNAV